MCCGRPSELIKTRQEMLDKARAEASRDIARKVYEKMYIVEHEDMPEKFYVVDSRDGLSDKYKTIEIVFS